MNDTLVKLYNHFPAPLRSVAASLRGLYLRGWRYGPETERLVEEALGRESWSLKQWRAWQEERLAYVLHRAATQVPYYREQWAALRGANPQRPGLSGRLSKRGRHKVEEFDWSNVLPRWESLFSSLRELTPD